MFSLIIWIVFGWIAGTIAEALYPPSQSHGKLQTIGIGIAGSVAGGVVGAILTGHAYSPAGLVASVIGAIGIMYAWKRVQS